MSDWLGTARAVIVGALKNPRETTVVVRDRRTGKMEARKTKSGGPPRNRAHRSRTAA